MLSLFESWKGSICSWKGHIEVEKNHMKLARSSLLREIDIQLDFAWSWKMKIERSRSWKQLSNSKQNFPTCQFSIKFFNYPVCLPVLLVVEENPSYSYLVCDIFCYDRNCQRHIENHIQDHLSLILLRKSKNHSFSILFFIKFMIYKKKVYLNSP